MDKKGLSVINQSRLNRCVNWLQEQNKVDDNVKVENDFNFILESHQSRNEFLSKDIDVTIPPGVDEEEIKPANVPLMKLRTEELSLECEWPLCKLIIKNYSAFQTHVGNHLKDLQIIKTEDEEVYACLWDTCNHKTSDYKQMVRHINYHAYHAKLLAIGLNARATLDLAQCKKDSTHRNRLPELKTNHICMWVHCNKSFNSMQRFLEHVRSHLKADNLVCSWAGCGAEMNRLSPLVSHVRSHTGERQIACYHCGMHFATNSKLVDHVDRQATPMTNLSCAVCGICVPTPALLKAHARAHVSTVACPYCDMSLFTTYDLAVHVRARHLPDEHTRLHPCPMCEYVSKRKADLRVHIERHNRKKRKLEKKEESDDSDSTIHLLKPKKNKVRKKYCCHMCDDIIFSRGNRLTKHLVTVHGVQWPCGHSRFKYQISDDGMYRLTTTRYESLEVSKKIMEREKPDEPPDTEKYDAHIEKIIEAEPTQPKQIVLAVKEKDKREQVKNSNVEITMCDVDEFGNIIKTSIVNPDDVVIIKSEKD